MALESRRSSVQKETERGVATSAQFVQVNLMIPLLGGLHQFIPGDFASSVSRRARHHAGKGRFSALGGLIMEITARDAFNEGLLFSRIGEFEVGSEIPGSRKAFGIGRILGNGTRRLPRIVTPDAKRPGIGRLRGTLGAEKTLGDVPPALGKLRGTEGDINPIGVLEED